MDTASVMGELDDDGEAGTGGWGPLFTEVAGDGSGGALEGGGCCRCGCGDFGVLWVFADFGMLQRGAKSKVQGRVQVVVGARWM